MLSTNHEVLHYVMFSTSVLLSLLSHNSY